MNNNIENKAVIKIDTCDNQIEIASIELITKPIKLQIEKKQDCDFVLIGDNIKYSIEIKNQCGTEVEDIIFEDKLDKCTRCTEGSFKVNGETKKPEIINNCLIYKIERIKSCETICIVFEVCVTDDCCNCNPEPDKSATPTVKQIEDNANSVQGTGIPYATVYVEFPNGNVIPGTVNNGSNWNINAPQRLYKGQIVSVWQLEPGKEPSDIISVIVV